MFDRHKKTKIDEVDLSPLLPRYNGNTYLSRYMGHIFDPNFKMRVLLRSRPQFSIGSRRVEVYKESFESEQEVF